MFANIDLFVVFFFQGYYMKNDVFGKEGDFITSPEISQVFGEVSHFSINFNVARLFVVFLCV